MAYGYHLLGFWSHAARAAGAGLRGVQEGQLVCFDYRQSLYGLGGAENYPPLKVLESQAPVWQAA